MKKFALAVSVFFASIAFAQDVRDEAIQSSSEIKALLDKYKSETGVDCKLTVTHEGRLVVDYFFENGLSKFSALLICDNGEGGVVTGVLGEGGQTTQVELVWAD